MGFFRSPLFRATLAGLFACLLSPAVQAAAPAPAKSVELQRYVGRWYEVARVPNHFEKGRECDGPTADYNQDASGAVTVVQTCHQNSPNGPEKVYRAAARILDPGINAKFKLTFFLVVSKEYWVLDHAADYGWAIVGDPTGEYVWLFSRRPTVPAMLRDSLVARAKALGYDVDKLEFPPQG
jgi:apolipoprotein D and lipocalin family protein